MNKKTQIGIFGLNYENNLENFYIDAFKKLNYKNIKFLSNNFLFYIFCLLQNININFLFKIFNIIQKFKIKKFLLKNDIEIFIIFKGIELNKSIYKLIKEKKIILINIYTDDPFNFTSSATTSKNIIMNIENYDIFCVWSQTIKKKLEKKFKKTKFFYLPFGYSQDKHQFDKKKIIRKKITFIGAYDEYRYKILSGINSRVDIYGNNWPKFKKHTTNKYVKNEELREIIAKSEISLNILRKQNFTSHNMKTFEIPSMGGLMLTTKSAEQNKFFPENKASFMFKDIQELNRKIQYILCNNKISQKIRHRSFLLSKKHSYKQRVKSLIRFINKYEKLHNN